MKWLVTGANGHARHRPRRRCCAPRGRTSPPLDVDTLDVTDAGRRRRGGRGPRRGRQRGRLDGRRRRREARGRRPDRQRRGRPAARPRGRAAHGARLVQISTDYVFDGSADARRTPRTRRSRRASAYGRTKAAGEQAVREELPRRPPDRPHRLAVRRARRLLPQDHRPAGPRAGPGRRRRRPGGPADLDRRTSPTWSSRLVAGRRARRDLPRDVVGPVQLVRLRPAPWSSPPGSSPRRCSRRPATAFVRPAPRPAYSVLGHEALVDARRRADRRLGGALGRGRARPCSSSQLTHQDAQARTADPWSSHHRAAARCQPGAVSDRPAGPSAGDAVMPRA